MTRTDILRTIAASIVGTSRSQSWPTRVAVDGRTASGKTTLANELAQEVKAYGSSVIRLSIDGYHNSREQRYRRSRTSPLGYLDDARDWHAIREKMLAPLGPEGDRRYVEKIFDLHSDSPITPIYEEASDGTIVIVDGSFLRREELWGCFDRTIVVNVSREISIARGAIRDADLLGGHSNALAMFEHRYAPAYDTYLERLGPNAGSDIEIENDDFVAPSVRIGLK